ncbi:MAG: type III-B CRISPR module RAMP protein Cmr6, partial [Candidatus Korarchaeum sp.]|nr:type III-B CRISPR module RAMP protein Cmr6 [Candidatus Korarchaeum sp.]
KGDLKKIGVLFGTRESRGSLLVIGGFIKSVPNYGFLRIDVTSPHYKPYYEGKKREGDWPREHFDPVPILFPVVSEGTTFFFSLFVKEGLGEDYLKYVKEVLHYTLTRSGVGGKTSSGYGIFYPYEAEGSLQTPSREARAELRGRPSSGIPSRSDRVPSGFDQRYPRDRARRWK